MTSARPSPIASGILPSDVRAARSSWFPVAQTDVLRGGPVPFGLFGDEYVAWLDGSHRPVALPRRCPHRRADLARGQVRDEVLVCEYHGWTFGRDGRCVFVPQLEPGVAVPRSAHLVPLAATTAWGMVWVWGDAATQPGPLPCWPEAGDEHFDTFIDTVETWQAPAFRVVDNLLDVAHAAFLHTRTIGDASAPRVGLVRVDATPSGVLSVVRERCTAETGPDGFRTKVTETLGPLTVRIRTYTGPGGSDGPADFSLLTVAVPIDDTTTSYVRFQSADYRLHRRHDEARRFSASVLAEDRPVVEHLEQRLLVEPEAEVHLPLDQPTLAYRRYLAGLVGVQAFDAAPTAASR